MVNTIVSELTAASGEDALARLAPVRSVEDLVAGVVRHNGGLEVARLRRIAIVGAAPEGERLARIVASGALLLPPSSMTI